MDDGTNGSLDRLHDFVHWRRKFMKWRQQMVADRAGVSQSWVAALESGRLSGRPLEATLIKLAKGLALPHENPGSLYGFLDLLIVSQFEPDIIRSVAEGTLSPDEAIVPNEWASNEPPPSVPEDKQPVMLDRQTRTDGLALVLKVLRRDLSPDDFVVARRIVEVLYEQRDLAIGFPHIPEESPHSELYNEEP